MNDDLNAQQTRWPGLWSGRFLHLVLPGNEERLCGGGRFFGLSECGVACVRTRSARPALEYCPQCFPLSLQESGLDLEGPMPLLPRRVPGRVPPPVPNRRNPNSPWFSSFEPRVASVVPNFDDGRRAVATPVDAHSTTVAVRKPGLVSSASNDEGPVMRARSGSLLRRDAEVGGDGGQARSARARKVRNRHGVLAVLIRAGWKAGRRAWAVSCRDRDGRRSCVRVSIDERGPRLTFDASGAAILRPSEVGQLRALLRTAIEIHARLDRSTHGGEVTPRSHPGPSSVPLHVYSGSPQGTEPASRETVLLDKEFGVALSGQHASVRSRLVVGEAA